MARKAASQLRSVKQAVTTPGVRSSLCSSVAEVKTPIGDDARVPPGAASVSPWVTEEELGAYLNKSARTLQRFRVEGRPNALPFTWVGGQVRYHLPTIDKILLDRMQAATGCKIRAAG